MVALLGAGRFTEVDKAARTMLLRDQRSATAWQVLGSSLWAQGKDAVLPLQRAAELMPHSAEALSNWGNALRAAGRLESAVDAHRRAIALEPGYAKAHNNLGSALLDIGRLDDATESFRRAVILDSQFALAENNLAHALTLQNRSRDGELHCRRALQIDPTFTSAIVLMAEIQADRGNFDAAEELLRSAIAIEPDMPEAWSGLVRWRKVQVEDSRWLAQAERISRLPLPPRREVHLRYALGKYFDDLGSYDQAFDNFRRANDLTKSFRRGYSRRDLAAAVDHVVASQTLEWVKSRSPERPNPSERPVFVVGMPRSGTTLVEQILAAHPEIFGAGELSFWNQAAASVAADGEAGETGRLELIRHASAYLKLLNDLSPAARRVIDKMPANFLHLGVIHAALPNAKIIHMTRNPPDTCLSIYFQNFGAEHPYANDLEDLAHYYAEYARLMRHWRRSLPHGVVIDVPYESLVQNPEAWSRRMLSFIGLTWDPSCLDCHQTRRHVGTFSKWQVRQKITRSSVNRWRHYAKYVGPLQCLAEEIAAG